jgi:protein-S-isoprenylcysteine O-methyltransferase Ste14
VLYGIASYLIFFCSLIYAVGFIGNFLVPKSIDSGPEGSLAWSVLIDVFVLGAFAIPHSVMARPRFKRWWLKIVPPACERSTYVLISSLLLFLIFWGWRPVSATVWWVEGWPAFALSAVYWFGWLTALLASFMIDHFEMFGLRQVFARRRAGPAARQFRTPMLYRLVRHPIMLGFLLAFWATPHMTAGHLLFSVMTTGYILVGIRLEERDLVADFGRNYQSYRRHVPMLMPRLLGRRRAPLVQPDAD